MSTTTTFGLFTCEAIGSWESGGRHCSEELLQKRWDMLDACRWRLAIQQPPQQERNEVVEHGKDGGAVFAAIMLSPHVCVRLPEHLRDAGGCAGGAAT
jgi:hypothetical protein